MTQSMHSTLLERILPEISPHGQNHRSSQLGASWNNPYLDLWYARRESLPARQIELAAALTSGDAERLHAFSNERRAYGYKFGYAVPTGEALLMLRSYAPLIEIGAGSGYWAWMLRQANTDIIAYDLHPPRIDSDANRFHVRTRCWTDVLQGDESAIARHPDRTLFLCWPPANDPMAFRTLQRYERDVFVFVGEAPLANNVNVTGDTDFVRLLEEEWTIEHSVALPNWELCWDKLYVFRRSRHTA